MDGSLVLVNGLPGSGKSTLAAPLGRALRMPVVSRDLIKEALADTVDVELPTSSLGAVASEAMWKLAAMMDRSVIVESFWLTGRDETFLAQGVALIRPAASVEVWCDVPVELAHERYLTRPRHHAHDDQSRTAEWVEWARRARPCSGFANVTVSTATEVDVPALAVCVKDALRMVL